MDRLVALIKRQPIATIGVAITTLVVAAIGVLNAFQPGTVTDAQIEEVKRFLAALWVVLALIWPTVTPAAAPKLPEGKSVQLKDGTAGTVVRR